jgi:hypothetical protein
VERIVEVYVNQIVEVEKIVTVPLPWEQHRLAQLNRSWGQQIYQHCALNFTLGELRHRAKGMLPPKFRTGGLGSLMLPDIMTWTCVQGHDCSGESPPQDGWFCWVLDELIALPHERAPEQWVPWGHNCDLKLV